MQHCGRHFDTKAILEGRWAVATKTKQQGGCCTASTPARAGCGCAWAIKEKKAALCDHWGVRPLLGSTVAARPGAFHTLDGATGHFILLGPCCRCHLLPLPPDNRGGEEGRKMLLNKNSLLRPSTKNGLTFLPSTRSWDIVHLFWRHFFIQLE